VLRGDAASAAIRTRGSDNYGARVADGLARTLGTFTHRASALSRMLGTQVGVDDCSVQNPAAVHDRSDPGAVDAPVFTLTGLDALPPVEMARKAEHVGVAKAGASAANTFALSVLAGAFIAMGAIFATTVTAGGESLPYGVARLLAGLAFSLGLILVVVAGAELFTGNNLIVMAWASRRVSTARLLRNWALVYTGNFVGAIATAGILFVGKQYEFGKGAVGAQALTIAAAKTDLGFVQAIALGAFCNALVCLAVWLCYSARTTADKILAIVPPIAAFVAAGFEHSVANMFFIPMGLLVKSDNGFISSQAGLPDLAHLSWGRFFAANLLPVTIGNIIGGAVMVGSIYWFVYLRDEPGR
jgi:formate transporter